MSLRSIAEMSELIQKGRVSPVEVTRECLETIERLNPTLNAFITVTAESALAEATIGTDTAGSIREPAALCGIVGLKPTLDLVSTSGIIPLSQSLDHAGPITRCVEDVAILLDSITDTKANHRDSLRRDISEFVIG